MAIEIELAAVHLRIDGFVEFLVWGFKSIVARLVMDLILINDDVVVLEGDLAIGQEVRIGERITDASRFVIADLQEFGFLIDHFANIDGSAVLRGDMIRERGFVEIAIGD